MREVRKHKRKLKNKVSVVRKHYKKGNKRTVGGQKYVHVDGRWKKDSFPNTPKPGWGYEKLVKEKAMYEEELRQGLTGEDILPPRKLGLLTRRIKKINGYLKTKIPTA